MVGAVHHDRPTPAPTEAADELEPNAIVTASSGGHGERAIGWQEWNQAIAPVVAARRRTMRLLGDKQAVRILFEEIAPRFVDRRRLHPRAAAAQAAAWATPAPVRSSNWSAGTTACGGQTARPAFESDRPTSSRRPAAGEGTNALQE